ncbi:MAG: GFA family protein [Pseudomonadota bacterium]|nr:GFA family protein [Pseudomonadota bacterium]
MDVRSTDPVTLRGQCHCGAVRFEVKLSEGLASARRCNCSYCSKRGAVAVTARSDGLKIIAGDDQLATYRFNTRVAEHHFCTTCGIYTHHRRRSNPDQLGVNVACLDGLSPFDFPEVPVNEGRIHPSDRPDGKPDAVAGWLRFTPAP